MSKKTSMSKETFRIWMGNGDEETESGLYVAESPSGETLVADACIVICRGAVADAARELRSLLPGVRVVALSAGMVYVEVRDLDAALSANEVAS